MLKSNEDDKFLFTEAGVEAMGSSLCFVGAFIVCFELMLRFSMHGEITSASSSSWPFTGVKSKSKERMHCDALEKS